MKLGTIRRWSVRAIAVGAAAATASLMMGVGPASAQTVPTGSPRWFIGHVETDRNAGSDTTFFMMQRISDLYSQAGLFGCTLNADNATCNTSGDISTTDLADNYDRVEQVVGIDHIGSSAGIGQLCGTVATPFPVDYARSSRGLNSSDCSTAAGLGFAKDGVPAVDFTANPANFGGSIGPVALGWRPGDPVGGPYSGRAFTSLTNNDNGGGTNSTAYRIYCETGSNRITDWGQLTDPSQPIGQGAPIGVPIVVIGVNPASGTFATYTAFAQSGASSCNINANAASNHIALENDAAQLGDFLNADHPGDQASQATELSEMLYFMSDGVYNTNSFARTVQIPASAGPASATATKVQENGVSATTSTKLNNTYPTARTLYNVYRTDTVRASTAGFLNWICDSNNAFTKGKNLQTGKNYDTELTTLIGTTFGFPRLTDASPAPNNSCQLITSVADANS